MRCAVFDGKHSDYATAVRRATPLPFFFFSSLIAFPRRHDISTTAERLCTVFFSVSSVFLLVASAWCSLDSQRPDGLCTCACLFSFYLFVDSWHHDGFPNGSNNLDAREQSGSLVFCRVMAANKDMETELTCTCKYLMARSRRCTHVEWVK